MQVRPDGTSLFATTVVATLAGLVLLTGLFTGLQIVTGRLNMADVLHRLPKPVAAVFVEDADAAWPLACDGLDETDPAAVVRVGGACPG